MFQVSCYDCLLINVFKLQFYTKMFMKINSFIKLLLTKSFDLLFQNGFPLSKYRLDLRMLNLLLPDQLSFHYVRTLFCFIQYCDCSNIYIFMFYSFSMICFKTDFLQTALQISKYNLIVYFNESLSLFKSFASVHVMCPLKLL